MKDIRLISLPNIEESIYGCHCIERNPSLYKYEIAWKSYECKNDDAYCRRCGKGLFTHSEFKASHHVIEESSQ